jgi:hypothetical protein
VQRCLKFLDVEPTETPPHAAQAAARLWTIRVDAATREVIAALERGGIGSIVLKGPSLSAWYPADSARIYSDGDIWVAPNALDSAAQTLTDLGFVPSSDERKLPGWWLAHASNWDRALDDGKIDLHRHLQGVGADPQRVWSLLWPRRVEFELLGARAFRLDDAAQALYVTAHATHHGVEDARGLPHLAAALTALDDDTWRAALALADELEALESFATGLRLVPGGVALAERIGVPDSRSVKATLLASTPPPVALGFDQLADARGLNRFRVLLRKFFPPAGFIRAWWPPAARSRTLLAVGYAYRPIWLLRYAPQGYRAWRAARRSVKSSS